MSSRTRYTSLGDGKVSSPLTVSCGVSQGSVLGPILFLIYMNDLANSLPESKIRLFADDTNIFLYGLDLPNINNKCNKVLEDVSDWMLANRLSINIEKTNYTIFSPTRINRYVIHFNLSINGVSISKAQCVKYLGVYIDEDLKWNEHVTGKIRS